MQRKNPKSERGLQTDNRVQFDACKLMYISSIVSSETFIICGTNFVSTDIQYVYLSRT
jgi:hypothetical protein